MRTYATEFPDFVLDVVIPEGFHDQSWHNDVCPSFSGRGVRLWIDYKDPEQREMMGKRFMMQRENEDGEPQNEPDDLLLETDDWNEVLAKIATLL